MPTREMVEYEAWGLDNTAMPPHSRLYHLSPAGFGTGAVESLTSYFSRLAQAHCVSAGALTHHELLPRHAGKRNMFACAVTAKTRCFTSTINNVGNIAARFASVVGKLTGRTDLSRLTMLPWKSMLPPQLLTRGVAAWCPRCLTTWRDSGKIVCMPLLWALEVVRYCPDHRCPLQSVCSNCGRPQPLLSQCCPVGHCSHCKSWLGAVARPDQSVRYSLLPPETPEWEIWVAQQAKGLIRTGCHSSDLLTKQQLSSLIRAATDAVGLSSLCRILGVSPAPVTLWRAGRASPMFPTYLRIAYTLNVTLADLLTGKVEPSSVQPIDVFRVPYWRAIRVSKRANFNVHQARRLLNEALQESPPPSLRSFQKRTGYHYATLRGHLPDLCAQLCARFQRHQATTIENRLQDKICEFRNIAYQLHAQGVELLVNRVLKRMSCPRSLVYRLACELLADIKREILVHKNAPCNPV